jgi:hypothetical protein
MQAIVTKYHGATNFRGSRVSAKASAGRVTVSWDDALDVDANHRAAAVALCRKFGWHGTLVEGGLPEGTGNVYTFQAPHTAFKVKP